MATVRDSIGKYLFNLALALDQFLNVILLGDPDDTISSRLGRANRTGRPKWFVKPMTLALDFMMEKLTGEINHCDNSVETEEVLEKELWSWIKNY